MNRQTQGLLMAFLGVVLARLSASDIYLRYVTPWMKWPVLISGLVIAALGFGLIVTAARQPTSHHGDVAEDGDHPKAHAHGVPLVTWLLVLPGLMFFLVSPPELGSYLAERRSGEAVAAPQPKAVEKLDGTSERPIQVDLTEFVWRAQDGGQTLEGQTVSIDGFVSMDKSGNWLVTQMVISCCAADALAYGVQVEGAEAPPRDQWVRVTGVYVEGSGVNLRKPPLITASAVKLIDPPRDTYG